MTPAAKPSEPSRRAAIAVAAALAVLVLGGLVAFLGHRSTSTSRAGGSSPTACNGVAGLCAKRLNEVVFAGTHNSYAAAEEPGWYFANQNRPISRQLADGIRAFLIDVHFGVYDPSVGRVRTDLQAEGSDANKVTEQLPAAALRVADRVAGQVGLGTLKGTSSPYLCHTLCELGAEPLDQELDVIKRFLDAHEDQVVILIVEDYVPATTVVEAFERAGLGPSLARLDGHGPLPTLGALIASGKRLVVFAEKHGGSPSWYMPAFSFIQDTPLSVRPSVAIGCERYRGERDSPLLLLNNWIASFPPVAALNAPIGRAGALRQRLRRCDDERGTRAGILAVDFYERTDVVRVADQLNEELVRSR